MLGIRGTGMKKAAFKRHVPGGNHTVLRLRTDLCNRQVPTCSCTLGAAGTQAEFERNLNNFIGSY